MGTFSGVLDEKMVTSIPTDGYTDSGTFKFVPPGSMISTGRLGTGTWRRINKASPNGG